VYIYEKRIPYFRKRAMHPIPIYIHGMLSTMNSTIARFKVSTGMRKEANSILKWEILQKWGNGSSLVRCKKSAAKCSRFPLLSVISNPHFSNASASDTPDSCE
jgi:hypothetical protein